VLKLIKLAKKAVKERYGIELREEIVLAGEK
jgi:UDP-N-acetylenolpyruvoylglucosamine reductase